MTIIRRSFIGLAVAALVLNAGAAWAVKYSFTSFDYPGASSTFPTDINNSGQIVGTYGVGEIVHGFLKVGAKYTSIDYPGAIVTYAYGINDSGQILGDYFDGEQTYNFLKVGNTYTTILAPEPLNWYLISDINNSGHTVGIAENDVILKVGNSYTTFIPPSGWVLAAPFGGVSRLNDADQIVGIFYHDNPPNSKERGFLLDGGVFIPFDYPGARDTYAFRINNAGQIVGQYYDTDTQAHGFVKVGNRYSPFEYPGAIETRPSAINDLGQIIGDYYDGSNYHPFLATPIPSPVPSSLLFLGTGLVGLAGWRLRKG